MWRGVKGGDEVIAGRTDALEKRQWLEITRFELRLTLSNP
jgi:hypothetical protein